MNKTGYYESQVPTYLKEWERRKEVVARVAALERLHHRVWEHNTG